MKDEIKEILDNLIRYRYLDAKCKQPEDVLTTEDMWILLDYITNLQQENERLKDGLVKIPRAKLEYELELIDYKSRVEKAVEYIKTTECYDDVIGYYMLTESNERDEMSNLLNILQGSDKE
jgi:hypothetical protein